MEAVQDMGGTTSNSESSRLQFPMSSKKITDQQNLLELIRQKETQRLKKAKQKKLIKGGKTKAHGVNGKNSGVLTYTKDGRTVNRK